MSVQAKSSLLLHMVRHKLEIKVCAVFKSCPRKASSYHSAAGQKSNHPIWHDCSLKLFDACISHPHLLEHNLLWEWKQNHLSIQMWIQAILPGSQPAVLMAKSSPYFTPQEDVLLTHSPEDVPFLAMANPILLWFDLMPWKSSGRVSLHQTKNSLWYF